MPTVWAVRSHLNAGMRARIRKLVDAVAAPLVGSISSGTDQDRLALTIDDGPDPEVTPELIDLFAELDVRATFFLLTLRAESYAHQVHRLLEAGHEIALHGLDHRRVSTMSRSESAAYLGDAKLRMEQVCGLPVQLFRPPYGAQSLASFRGARDAGLDVVVWNGDAQDWVDRPGRDVADSAITASRPGGILLLHERLEPDLPRAAPVTTFDRRAMFGDVVTGVRSRSLEPGTVAELASAGRLIRTAWFRP